ncbi:hypothetical protein MMC19_004430 [Ptychographa xylographoides]|nr:hypothetical protein [Ptychographa xylographoides]
MIDSTNILIHISASGLLRDDAKYRKQALAFLEFEAVSRHQLTERSGKLSVTDRDRAFYNDGTISQRNTQNGVSKLDIGIRDDGNQLDNTSEHPLNISVPETPSQQTPASLRSSNHPPVITYVPNTITPRISVSRNPVLRRPSTAPSFDAPLTTTIQRPRAYSHSWATPPSVVPDSQPLEASHKREYMAESFVCDSQNSTPVRKRQKVHSFDRDIMSISASEEVPHSSTDQLSTSPDREPKLFEDDQTVHGHKSPKGQLPVSQENCYIATQGILPEYNYTSSQLRFPFSSPGFTDESNLLAEIHPPPPKTALESFTTHITTSLAVIEANCSLERHYNPTYTTRSLRTLERGYWEFVMNDDWSTALRDKFWSFLEQLVGEGRAGWGVWCERLECVESKKGTQTIESRYPGRNTGSGSPAAEIIEAGNADAERTEKDGSGNTVKELRDEVVKMYCWGEVVGHIYLVLYIAGDRRIKYSGAKWVDSSGNTVIGIDAVKPPGA